MLSFGKSTKITDYLRGFLFLLCACLFQNSKVIGTVATIPTGAYTASTVPAGTYWLQLAGSSPASFVTSSGTSGIVTSATPPATANATVTRSSSTATSFSLAIAGAGLTTSLTITSTDTTYWYLPTLSASALSLLLTLTRSGATTSPFDLSGAQIQLLGLQ